MNKTIGYVIGGIVVVAAIVVFAMNRGQDDSSSTGQEQGNMMNESSSAGGHKTMRQLLVSSNQQCTFSSADDNAQSSGKVYVAGGMMRGDFESTNDGQTAKSHMVIKDETMFTWMDGMNTGFKAILKSVENNATSTKDNSVDPNQELDFDCKGWSADSSMFDLPNIEFMDTPSFTGSAGTQQNPDVCAQVPAEQREACEKALGL